jgi:hypothetical protein
VTSKYPAAVHQTQCGDVRRWIKVAQHPLRDIEQCDKCGMYACLVGDIAMWSDRMCELEDLMAVQNVVEG